MYRIIITALLLSISSVTTIKATDQISKLTELAKLQHFLFYTTNLNKTKDHHAIFINMIDNCLKNDNIEAEAKNIIKTNHLLLFKKSVDSSCIPFRFSDFDINNLIATFPVDKIINKWNSDNFYFEKKFEKKHPLSNLSTKLYILFYVKGVLDHEYAYSKEKQTVSDTAFRVALSYTLQNKYSFNKTLQNMLVKLKDPHLILNDNSYKDSMTDIVRKDSLLLFPFDFKVYKQSIYAIERKTKQVYLLDSIDSYSSKNLCDSVLFFASSNNEEQNEQNILLHISYSFFKSGYHRFSLLDTIHHKKISINVKREAIEAKAHSQLYRNNYLPNFLKSKKRLNFSRLTNREFINFFNSLNEGDTVVIDFSGYPTRHISALLKLLPESEKPVAIGFFSSHTPGCFLNKEVYTYNSKKVKNRIAKKNITIYGRVNCYTGSYVETSVMILKTYLPNFITIGSPTAGAMGTINWKELPGGVRFSYPYHKFEFIDKNQVNKYSQIIPDILYYNNF